MGGYVDFGRGGIQRPIDDKPKPPLVESGFLQRINLFVTVKNASALGERTKVCRLPE